MSKLIKLYQRLFEYFGPQYWWPAETPFEVMVGAVLTQNTNWINVEKAIANLKDSGPFTISALLSYSREALAELIRPAGYYNLKEKRLRNLLMHVQKKSGGDIALFLSGPLNALRSELLAINGIGPETADCILLYAGGRPSFVVDAYTKRILARHGMVEYGDSYEDIRGLFMKNLPADTQCYNEYHALLVRLGKQYCKKQSPQCPKCPLEDWPRRAKNAHS